MRWKKIPGTNGMYEVSDTGLVVSHFFHKRTILRQYDNGAGYFKVPIVMSDGTKKRCYVHRLVAEAFVKKVPGCDVVNHLDCNPANNCAENLEWTTDYGNNHYAIELGHMDRTPAWLDHQKAGLRRVTATPVIGTNIVTGEEIYLECIQQGKEMGFQPSCICDCCHGKRATTGGYRWRYA